MFRYLMMGLLALALSGCGSMRLVDNNVRSYALAPIPTGASYRFERLPSQQTDAAQQARLEAIVQQALARVGLQRNDAAANYSVQVAVGMKVDPAAPWDQPSYGWGPGWNLGWGVHSGNLSMGARSGMLGFGMMALPYYWRQVSLVIRQLSTGQVVYETHATHDGRWEDSEAVLPAMFEAALQGFPNPPPGVRRVNIDIPR